MRAMLRRAALCLLLAPCWLFTGPLARNIRSRTARAAEYRTVAVPGATGQLGRLVVEQLLSQELSVLALTRNLSKAELLPADERVKVVSWDPKEAEADAVSALADADVTLWCAEGREGVAAMGKAMAAKGARPSGAPRVVMCSSAAVTRPVWSRRQKEQLAGAADIPIVRLNPGGLLDQKRGAEQALRGSGASYAVVRPTGLKDDWPAGRPVLSQGDVAVGRTSRQDLAQLLARMLDEPKATGKTFEVLTMPGYTKPAGYDQALARLRPDAKGPLGSLRQSLGRLFGDEQAATYGVLQQLLPGEEQDSAGLAMGQTYEQYDKKEEGRLGPRGAERVPSFET
ncbi:unnamed protein product [Effrenium voratum]|uniref:NAD(P)-binding domain-containing protein n=1 Tax=Effrenium voratum TaxID=2562239 RepID=A0AA36HL04_9DINO|nr:unnamed protein product [Effrenium voratum]